MADLLQLATLDNPVFKAAGIDPSEISHVQPATPASIDPSEIASVQSASPSQAQAIDPSQISHIDDFHRRTVEDLHKDEKFDPRAYFSDNPDVAKDPAQLQKLIDVYRARRERGVTLGALGEGLKAAPGTAVKFAKGLGQLANNVFEFSVGPLFNKAASVLTGDAFNTQRADALEKESENRARQAYSEFQAGTELSATGLSDLGRTGARKIFGKSVKDLSNQELLAQLSEDASFQNQLREVQSGRGETLKNAGLDADTLAKDGIHLDSNAIENLSLVDPATVLATAGLFKVVGAGGKVLATAANEVGAAKAATALNNFATQTAGKAVQGAGRAVTAAGEGAAKVAGAVPEAVTEATGAAAGLAKSGSVSGAYVGAKAARGIQAGIVKGGEGLAKVGQGITNLGEQITGQIPVSAGVKNLADFVGTYGRPVTGALKGAAIGTAAAAPLALLADEDQTAGGILSGGIALGGVAGGLHGTHGAVTEAASNRYFGAHEKVLPAVNSPAYGIEPALDTAHEAGVQGFSVRERNLLNNFREGTRNLGGEFYALNEGEYTRQVAEAYKRETGNDITPELLKKYADTHAQFSEYRPDAQGNIRKVVLLNADAKGLLHDAGHLFDAALTPEMADSLRQAVRETFTPEQLADAQARYERRLGEKLTPERAMSEFVAEQFNALFHNVPLSEMTAPRSLINRFADVIAQGAEALGVDLTAGKTTPSLQNPLSVGLRELFKNAAAEVTKANENAQPAPPAGPAAGPTPGPSPTPGAPTAPGPAGPAPFTPVILGPPGTLTAPPAPAAPAAPATPAARNIRVTPAQQDAFAKRAADIGVTEAKANAAGQGPDVAARVKQISDSMEAGNPVLEIEHLGIVNEGSAAAPSGRTPRRGEQAKGYADLAAIQADNRANAPASIVDRHQKTFVPGRWTNQGGTPTLIAFSIDKIIRNMRSIVADAADKNSSRLIPYESENGKLTEAGWNKAIADAQAYAENQSNGFRGDGRQLTRPTEDLGFSIPAENPDYKPQLLGEAEANFQNLIQGLATPETAREQKGLTPGNIKGQVLAEANKRPLLTPAEINPKNAGKQEFKSFPGRTLKEVNPLRNELAKVGVDVRDLIEVTERLRAKDITSVTPRPDINFKAPVTDIIRGGFLPGGDIFGRDREWLQRGLERMKVRLKEMPKTSQYRAGLKERISNYERWLAQSAPDVIRSGFLPPEEGKVTMFVKRASIAERGKEILSASPDEWNRMTQEMGGLTNAAFRLGVSLKDRADVGRLQEFEAKATAQFKDARATKDLDTMFAAALKKQFFTEALQAATGEGGSKTAMDRILGPDWKPPFPEIPQAPVGPLGQFLPKVKNAEAVDKAAVRDKETGAIFAGNTHGEAMRNASVASGVPKDEFSLSASYANPNLEQGFVTQGGDFLTRSEALTRVGEIGQISPENLADASQYKNAKNLESVGFEFHRKFLPKENEPKGKNTFPEDRAESVNKWSEVNQLVGLWLGPDGKFFDARPDHYRTAEEFIVPESKGTKADPRDAAYAKGWIRVNLDGSNRGSGNEQILIEGAKPTRAQKQALEDAAFSQSLPVMDHDGREVIANPNPSESQFLPKKGEKEPAFPKYVDPDFERTLNRYDREKIAKRGVTDEFLLHKDGQIVPAPSGHQAAIEELAQQSFEELSQAYEWAREHGFARGIRAVGLHPDDFHLSELPPGGLTPAMRKTMEDIAFKSGGRVHANGKDIGVGPEPTEPRFLPKEEPSNEPELWIYDGSQLQLAPVDLTHAESTDIKGQYDSQANIVSLVVPEGSKISSPEEVPAPLLSQLHARYGKDFTLKFLGSAGPGQLFLPKKKKDEEKKSAEFPGYVVPAPQNRGLQKTVDKNGVTPEFWINSKTGKILLAPDGHEEAAIATILKDEPAIRESDDPTAVYDAMHARDWVRGVLEPADTATPSIYLNGPPDTVLGASARRTMEDIAFKADRPVLFNDRPLDIGPKQPGEGEPGSFFMPKKQKRDDEGRPLTPDGLIDYERLYKDKIAAERKREADDASLAKYNVPNNQTELIGPKGLTGWGLPNKTFVPLDSAYHENYLAENADKLNAEFGTNFSNTPTVDDRLAALNAGFTRFRFEPNRAALHIETAAKNWAENRKQILDRVLQAGDSIDNLIVSLLDAEGGVVDSISEKLFTLEGPEKLNKIEAALDSLRARGSRYLPKARVNIGLAVNGKDNAITQADVLKELERAGVKVLKSSVVKSNTENTVVADLDKPLTPEQAAAVSKALKQDAIAQFANGEGELHGPKAAEWRPFNPNFFLNHEGEPGQPGITPKQRTLPGVKAETAKSEDERTALANKNVAEGKAEFPEALVRKYVRDENGNVRKNWEGAPLPVAVEYDLSNTPLAKAAAKGLKGPEREKAIARALGDRLVKEYKAAIKNPEIEAGSTWYSDAREQLKKVLGDDSKFFAELLGATSPQTGVDTNFKYAVEAYNQFKSGAYDDILAKYREGKQKWAAADIDDFLRDTKNEDPTRGQFLDWWVKKNNLVPEQSNGKRFGLHSRAVLRVLDGSWRSEVKGPKTPNFTGNLTGETFEATIDLWAARLLHRLANEGNPKRWRILPGQETGVTDPDFYLGQKAYRHAAEKLGLQPDSLQALLWFAEKHYWEQRGWAKSIGAKKSDYNSLLKETEKTPEGKLTFKKRQATLNL